MQVRLTGSVVTELARLSNLQPPSAVWAQYRLDTTIIRGGEFTLDLAATRGLVRITHSTFNIYYVRVLAIGVGVVDRKWLRC